MVIAMPDAIIHQAAVTRTFAVKVTVKTAQSMTLLAVEIIVAVVVWNAQRKCTMASRGEAQHFVVNIIVRS